MKQYLKRALFFILLFVMIVTVQSYAYTLREESKIDKATMTKIAGNKAIEFKRCSIARETGTMFAIGMDKKTRQWEWFHIDPFKKKLLNTGKCPFVKALRLTISPEGTHAFVASKYKTALYSIDLKSGKWTKIYRNPKMGIPGLAFRFFSYIKFLDNQTGISILEFWNASHLAVDTVISTYTDTSKAPEKLVSLNKLRDETAKKAGIDTDKNIYLNDLFNYGSDKSMVFVLKTQLRADKSKIADYLFKRKADGSLEILDECKDGRILPLFYDASTQKAIYLKATKGKNELILSDNGSKTDMAAGMFREACIMKNNLVGLGEVSKKNEYSVYLYKLGDKPKKLKTFDEPYALFFLNNGKEFVMISENLIRSFKIIDNK